VHDIAVAAQHGARSMRIAAASLSLPSIIMAEPPNARQSQRPLSHHRRVDRRGRRTWLQCLSNQERARGRADQCRARWAEDQDQVREAELAPGKAITAGALALTAFVALSLATTSAL